MKPPIPAWINFIFGLVGLIGVGSLETSLDIKYSRSLGGDVRDTRLACLDAAAQTATTRSDHRHWLWYRLFVLPLLPLLYPIVLGLRRHNFPVQIVNG